MDLMPIRRVAGDEPRPGPAMPSAQGAITAVEYRFESEIAIAAAQRPAGPLPHMTHCQS